MKGTGEFPAQIASNAENVSIWWRHHGDRVWDIIDIGSSDALVSICSQTIIQAKANIVNSTFKIKWMPPIQSRRQCINAYSTDSPLPRTFMPNAWHWYLP